MAPPSELACGVSKRATTNFANPSPWKVTCGIQAVAIEPPRVSAAKRVDTASIAPSSGSVALLSHRSRIIQVSGFADRRVVWGALRLDNHELATDELDVLARLEHAQVDEPLVLRPSEASGPRLVVRHRAHRIGGLRTRQRLQIDLQIDTSRTETLLGTLPIALGIGASAAARRPLGLAVVSGLLVSQLLALNITSVLYLYME